MNLKDHEDLWPVIGTETPYRNHLIAVRNDKVRFPDNSVSQRTVVQHPGAVAVAAVDDAGRLLMIRQYRHPVAQQLWEIPAGLRDVPGEDPLDTAKRELAEETSYRASDWELLVDYFSSPGFSTERIRVYLARGLKEVPAGESTFVVTHEEKYLERAWVPLQAAAAAVLAGDLHNGVAAVGILALWAKSNGPDSKGAAEE